MSQMTTPGLDEIDLTSPDFWSAPMEWRDNAFRVLREQEPFAFFEEPQIPDFPQGPGYYAVTRYADIEHISRNPQDFCSGRGSTSVADIPPEFMDFFGSMIVMDDPRHARLRGIVARRFTPKALQQLLDSVDETANEIIDDVIDQGEIDFVEGIAARLPLLIICDMMGIPRSREREVLHHTNVILSAGDPELIGEEDERRDNLIASALALTQMVNELAEQRYEHPTDDLTSQLIHAGEEGEDDKLTPAEIASFFILLVVAGNETTRTALTHGMYQLTRNPDQRDLLLADLETVVPTATEEIVRYASPVTYMRRTATRDLEYAGRQFKEGDKFVLFYGSGNRDASVFEDPDRFDVRRSPNPHIGFGAPGPHYCLGAHLARREINVMLTRLFQRIPDIEVSGPPEPLQGVLPLVCGIKRMPVRFTPGGAAGR